jgi:hypothetical protein
VHIKVVSFTHGEWDIIEGVHVRGTNNQRGGASYGRWGRNGGWTLIFASVFIVEKFVVYFKGVLSFPLPFGVILLIMVSQPP